MASISLPTAALALGAAGTGIGVLGQMEQGQAASNTANYQAEVAKNNAIIANQNAAYSSAAGSAAATKASLTSAATGGRIKAALGANQINVNTGSAADVEESQRETGTLDSLNAENNALLNAYGYKAVATSETAQAGLLEGEAAQAPIGADIGAAGTLLGNASSLGFKWGNGGVNNDDTGTVYGGTP